MSTMQNFGSVPAAELVKNCPMGVWAANAAIIDGVQGGRGAERVAGGVVQPADPVLAEGVEDGAAQGEEGPG